MYLINVQSKKNVKEEPVMSEDGIKTITPAKVFGMFSFRC